MLSAIPERILTASAFEYSRRAGKAFAGCSCQTCYNEISLNSKGVLMGEHILQQSSALLVLVAAGVVTTRVAVPVVPVFVVLRAAKVRSGARSPNVLTFAVVEAWMLAPLARMTRGNKRDLSCMLIFR